MSVPRLFRRPWQREYSCDCTTGAPKVAFRETASRKATFSYTHKKQSGGAGQYGKVEGYLEPLDEDVRADRACQAVPCVCDMQCLPCSTPACIRLASQRLGAPGVEFRNQMMGNSIPPEFLPAIEKGFKEALGRGSLCGAPVVGVRVVLLDGAAHAVDSNEISFRAAAIGGFKQAMSQAGALVLEPVMSVEVSVPSEFQGAAVAQLSQRKGTVNAMEGTEYTTIDADVPLNSMFGYSSDLRSATQGKGEFTMEYKLHAPVPREKQEELIKTFAESKKGKSGAGLI